MTKYLVRSDDFTVFSLNHNGTYSIHEMKINFPNSLHHEYAEDVLKKSGFFESEEKSLPEYKAKQDNYYRDLARQYEGHSGHD